MLLRDVLNHAVKLYPDKIATIDAEAWHSYERGVMLQSLDAHWRDDLPLAEEVNRISVAGLPDKTVAAVRTALLTMIENLAADEDGGQILAQIE